jgi:regulator of ribonuclease activity A
MGDTMAALAAKNGWAGAVIFGAIRDSAAIDALDFGIKAVGTTARRSAQDLGGAVDAPVAIGGVTFRPGDWVYADRDAVIVSARRFPEVEI